MSAHHWDIYSAVAACEGFDNEEHDHDDMVSAWQYLIDNGVVWELQGRFGRTARDMILMGLCHLPERAL